MFPKHLKFHSERVFCIFVRKTNIIHNEKYYPQKFLPSCDLWVQTK
jgi:hypothetical protein